MYVSKWDGWKYVLCAQSLNFMILLLVKYRTGPLQLKFIICGLKKRHSTYKLLFKSIPYKISRTKEDYSSHPFVCSPVQLKPHPGSLRTILSIWLFIDSLLFLPCHGNTSPIVRLIYQTYSSSTSSSSWYNVQALFKTLITHFTVPPLALNMVCITPENSPWLENTGPFISFLYFPIDHELYNLTVNNCY